MIKRKNKSKKQRQAWWKSLTPEQQDAYVEKIVAAKTKKRIRDMLKRGTKKKNCTTCLLGVGNHCDGYGAKKVCKDWYEIKE